MRSLFSLLRYINHPFTLTSVPAYITVYEEFSQAPPPEATTVTCF